MVECKGAYFSSSFYVAQTQFSVLFWFFLLSSLEVPVF